MIRNSVCSHTIRRVLFYLLCGMVPTLIPGRTILKAKVLRVEIDSREPVLTGKAFGEYGSYELLRGRIFFVFDPANPMNAPITDLLLAPRNADGRVEAWANFAVLQPSDRKKARGIALVEVSNRGRKPIFFELNHARGRNLNPASPDSFGDALMLREGITVLWVGWQFDVPVRDENTLQLRVPTARNSDGSPIFGLVRSDWTVDSGRKTLPLSHRNHAAYPVAEPEHPDNVLTERDNRDAPRRVVPRGEWRFAREENGSVVADRTHIFRKSGFREGKIYELVYRAKDPAVVGLGLAVIRDVISYAKFDKDAPFRVKTGVAAGTSQTGRFLRQFLYNGFNTDEEGRMAYDGLMILAAGGGRGSFNHRFAQPSRDAHPSSAFFYPTDIFPFTSRTQLDSVIWKSDGLLAHMFNPEHAPKTMYINAGYEYWGRAASLIHTTVDGTADVTPMPNERIYLQASGQHGAGGFPPAESSRLCDKNVFRDNPLDIDVITRSLMVRMFTWIEEDVPPPPSRYPHIGDGTLVPISAVNFPVIPDVLFPHTIHVAYRTDYGPRWDRGIVDNQPPNLTSPYPMLVSQVDELGNEIGGVRSIELRVPLATYTPWSLRTGFAGGSDQLYDFDGMFIPLPRTKDERLQTGDPRPCIETLYASRDEYLNRVRDEADILVDEGFLLSEDREYVLERSSKLWDWIVNTKKE